MQSEVSSVRQLDMFADGVREEHFCFDCGVDISHRRRDARRCEPCSTIRDRERAKNHYWANRTEKLEYMKRRRQTPEGKQIHQAWREKNPHKVLAYRQRQRQKHREKTGYNPEGRTCEDCNADISHRGHNAKRCVPCSTPPARTCIVCDNDIGKRGPSKFCSEECKVQDRRLKESMGWTMTCTKCNETKEYSEFRMHYSRRDSTCKSCESNATREYYQALPVEERRRRRRIQGQRERDKKAKLPPQQKTILRTKARQDHRRKLYGADFDEDRLYSEQEGKCAICEIPKSLEELELDHDHATGRLRGFLCKNCNFKLLPRYEKFPHRHQDSPLLNGYLLKGKRQ